jgi:predicted dienelactone hydrolase
MMRLYILVCSLVGVMLLGARPAISAPVGEIHRVTSEPTAALRDAQHRDEIRITVWYPAAADAVETPLLIGPPDKPLFNIGSVALDAAFADHRQRPVILLSHGFGGTARIMGWFGIAMAQRGYIVVAVDHPGSNGIDAITMAGSTLWWDHAKDLRAALDAIGRDAAIGPHLDMANVGVAGFSFGGFTALVAAGARVDWRRWVGFCRAHPDDGDCLPNDEFPAATWQAVAEKFEAPELAAEVAHAGDDHALPNLRAAFVLAPAYVQSLDPVSLSSVRVPVSIMLGDADTVVPATTGASVAAAAIPNARIELLPGVTHYDWVSDCTDAGRANSPVCKEARHQAEAHLRAIKTAEKLFGQYLPIRDGSRGSNGQ